MYICVDCGCIFEEPQKYREEAASLSHISPCWDGCPKCAGAYAELLSCSVCGRDITNDYLELANHELVCENCYTERRLGDNG